MLQLHTLPKYLLSLALAGAAFFPARVQACSWSGEDWEYQYSFFAPEMFEQPGMLPFHYSFHALYPDGWSGTDGQEHSLVQDWQGFLGREIPAGDIEHLVYYASPDQLSLVRARVMGMRTPLPGELAENRAVQALASRRDMETVDYLILAREMEQQNENQAYSWESSEDPGQAMDSRMNAMKAEMGARTARQPFIRERYAFQTIREDFFAGKYKDCIQKFDTYFPQPTGTQIYWWALERKAGALYYSGRVGESLYCFSRVFEQCPSRRRTSYLSKYIYHMNAWEDAARFCKGGQEKAALLALKAIDPEAPALPAMQEMYAVSPASPLLTLLLTREINKLENTLLPAWTDWNGEAERGTAMGNLRGGAPEALQQARTLATFADRVQQERKCNQPAVWALGAAWLHFLGSDFTGAASRLDRFRKENTAGNNAELARRAEVFSLVNQIASLPKVDRAAEEAAFDQLKSIPELKESSRNQRAADFLYDAFAWQYEKQGEMAKAYLCHKGMYDLQNEFDLELTQQMFAFAEKPGKTRFENSLLERAMMDRNILMELIGTLYLDRGDLATARDWFMRLPVNYGDGNFQVPGDPFVTRVPDCVNCDPGEGGYTKLSLVEKMMSLEKKAQGTGDAAAQASLELGNAWYHTSYYSFAWTVRDYDRSGSGWYGMEDYYAGKENNWWNERFDVRTARRFYAQAYATARDKELKTLALFMVAKCDWVLNAAGVKHAGEDYENDFMTLIRDYKGTRTCTRLLNECGVLNYYASAIRKVR